MNPLDLRLRIVALGSELGWLGTQLRDQKRAAQTDSRTLAGGLSPENLR